jgi:formate dehydrogenase major subunit
MMPLLWVLPGFPGDAVFGNEPYPFAKAVCFRDRAQLRRESNEEQWASEKRYHVGDKWDCVAQTSVGHSKESNKGPDMNNRDRERLKTPLIRENGKHRAASWDEALDRVAEGFRSQVEKHGPRTFGMFSCSKTTNELNYVAQKFVRSVIGTNNIDSCNRT